MIKAFCEYAPNNSKYIPVYRMSCVTSNQDKFPVVDFIKLFTLVSYGRSKIS